MTHTVGDLARLTGLTPRTLHHYESLGLLRPAGRSESGYRLYDDASIAQLHAVLAYRYLGVPLKEIAGLLADRAPPLRELLQRQAALVEERIEQHRRLLQALRRCTSTLAQADAPSTLEGELLDVITATRLCEATLSPEEHRLIARARESMTADDVAALRAESAALIRALDAQRLAGADPASAPVRDIARRMAALRERVAGTDPALHEKIREIGRQTPEILRAHGLTPELSAYADAARAALERHAAGAAAPAVAAPKRRGRATA